MNFPVEDWEAIPLETYKNLLAEVKERFSVVPEETVSVTEKSIKCMLGFISFFFAVGVFLIINHCPIHWVSLSIIIGFSAYNVWLGYTIIKLRPSHSIGLLPENVLSKDFNLNTGFCDEEKQKLFYYNAVKTYTQKITEGIEDTTKRAEAYDAFFRFTLQVVLLITLFLFLNIIFHPLSVKS